MRNSLYIFWIGFSFLLFANTGDPMKITTPQEWAKTESAVVVKNNLKWHIQVGYRARKGEKLSYCYARGYNSHSEASDDLIQFRSIIETDQYWKHHWRPIQERCIQICDCFQAEVDLNLVSYANKWMNWVISGRPIIFWVLWVWSTVSVANPWQSGKESLAV